MGLGQLANLSVGSCGQVLMMTGHQGTMMRIALLMLAFSIAAAFMVAPYFGTVGVAAVYAASTGLQGWVSLLAVRQKVGFYTHVKMITADDVRLVLDNVRARK
jgi:O-antigen/teichoic acid export membrane protein